MNHETTDGTARIQELERDRDEWKRAAEVLEADLRITREVVERSARIGVEELNRAEGLRGELATTQALLREARDRREQAEALCDEFRTASGLIGGSGDPSDVTPAQLERHTSEMDRALSESLATIDVERERFARGFERIAAVLEVEVDEKDVEAHAITEAALSVLAEVTAARAEVATVRAELAERARERDAIRSELDELRAAVNADEAMAIAAAEHGRVGAEMGAALAVAVDALTNVDAHMASERVPAAERLSRAFGLPWPPFPDAVEDEEEDESPAETATRAALCTTCNDTHLMYLSRLERDVPCTFCPVPCQNCRQGGNGPYCQTTPCGCGCHVRTAPSHAARNGEQAT